MAFWAIFKAKTGATGEGWGWGSRNPILEETSFMDVLLAQRVGGGPI